MKSACPLSSWYQVVEQVGRGLQGGDRALAFTSGMAAISAIVRLAAAGQHIIAGDDLYGGTSRLLQRVAPALGISVSNVDMTDPK